MNELKKANITVVQAPKYVNYDCPHCGIGVEIEYKQFESMMTFAYWGDWRQEEIECDACGEKFLIDDVEFD